MIRNLLFTVSFLFIVAAGFSQRSKTVTTGFKTGINISNLSSDAEFENLDDARIGYQATFFVGIPVNDWLTFQPELQYSAQGSKDEDFRANYINVPLMFQFSASEFLHFQLGPQAGVKIWEWEQQEDFQDLSISAVGGLAVNITDTVFIEGRYIYGFSNVLDDSNRFNIGENVKNSYIQISLGYRL